MGKIYAYGDTIYSMKLCQKELRIGDIRPNLGQIHCIKHRVWDFDSFPRQSVYGLQNHIKVYKYNPAPLLFVLYETIVVWRLMDFGGNFKEELSQQSGIVRDMLDIKKSFII